jgi:hypothetical protein
MAAKSFRTKQEQMAQPGAKVQGRIKMPQTQLPSAAGSTPAVRASAALAFLAPPPLIAGEDHAAYDDLLARISAALQPGDILEGHLGAPTSSTWCGTRCACAASRRNC